MDRDGYHATFTDLQNHGVQAGYIAGNVHYHTNHLDTPLSPSISIPFGRDPDFVNHGFMLKQLDDRFDSTRPRTALVGSGGTGKSHFAIEFAYKTHEQSPDTWVFWVYASNAARFEQSYQEIADTTKLSNRQGPKENILRQVYSWLRDPKNGKWVLILDKVDDARFLFSCQHDIHGQAEYEHNCTDTPLREYIPHCPHGFVIITSRSREEALKLVAQRNIITVTPLGDNDARALFRKKLGEKGRRKDIIDLTVALRFNPFAIVQAAAYISDPVRSRSYSVRQYLDEVIGRVHNNPSVTSFRNASDPLFQNLTTNPSSVEERKTCLSSLYFPEIHKRKISIKTISNACVGFSEHPHFQTWFDRTHVNDYEGLLLISGKPGSGKSSAMKVISTKLQQEANLEETIVVTYFFDAKGEALEHSKLGLLRSILFQILDKRRLHLELFIKLYSDKIQYRRYNPHSTLIWQVEELEDFLISMFRATSNSRTIIFVDALDECDSENETREIANLLRDITSMAFKARAALDICISSRHFSFVDLKKQPIIIMEHCNETDMRTYLETKFALANIPEEDGWLTLKEEIVAKSAGVFLWVVLVVDMLLKAKDGGRNEKHLRNILQKVPQALTDLFRKLVVAEDIGNVELLAKTLQWAILALKPLRLREWHQIFALISEPEAPTSFNEWRGSPSFTENDGQLERQLVSNSRGLLEVVSCTEFPSPQSLARDQDSDVGYAGSLELEQGETRLVQIIHESVRQFLLNEGGFTMIDDTWNPGKGHLSIMNSCLDCMQLMDWDSLVEVRRKFGGSYTRDNDSVASFGSASSYETRDDGVSPSRVSFFNITPTSEQISMGDAASVTRFSEQGYDSVQNDGPEDNEESAPEVTRALDFLFDDYRSASERSAQDAHSPSISLSVKSQQLGESPFLLHYSTHKFFSHAKLAELHGCDPAQIIKRISRMWDRYKLLREDIPRDRSLIAHCIHINLLSWIRCIETFDQTYKDAFAAVCHAKNNDAISVLALQEIVSLRRQGSDRTLVQWIAADDQVRIFRCWYNHVKELLKTSQLSQDTLVTYINRFDHLRATALSWACTGSREIFQGLLELGADPNKTEQWEYSPLLLVCERCRGDKLLIFLKELLKAGASTNYARFDDLYPFHILCHDNISVSGIKLLLEYSADPNVKDAHGRTPLHYIVSWNASSDFKWSIIEPMLGYGADLNSADLNGQTPLRMAATDGDSQLYRRIQRHIKADAPCRAGHTSSLLIKWVIGISVILVLVMVMIMLYVLWP